MRSASEDMLAEGGDMAKILLVEDNEMSLLEPQISVSGTRATVSRIRTTGLQFVRFLVC